MKSICISSGALLLTILAGCGTDDPMTVERCTPEPGTICTVAGLTGEAGIFGDEGPANEAGLYLPMDTKLGPDGTLYLVDWNNHRIRTVDGEGMIHTLAGTGELGDVSGPMEQAKFNHPTDLEFDPHGRLVIAAWHNSRIKKIDLSMRTVTDECGTGARAYNGDDGPAAMAVLDLPASIAFDRDGNLFFVDQANQVIRRIDPAGTISRFAGRCLVNSPPMDQPDMEPTQCMGTNKWGFDLMNNPMECMTPCDGGFLDGDALNARFSLPFGQAADPAGRIAIGDDGAIYLSDSRNHRIRKIFNGQVTTIAGNGMPGATGDGGPAAMAQVNNPVDIEIASDGTLYFADTFNSCIRAISPEGDMRTVAGICGMRGAEGDGGPPTEALLDRPYGIELAADGRIFIADTHNHVIRVITP